MKKSIEQLVQLARKGDQEAIAELYEQTYNSVYQSVRAVMKDEDEALDIVQDSYIKGFQNLDKLGDPEKYQAWMKRLASNMAIDYLRKKRPALFTERIDEDGEEIDLRHQDDCLEHMPEEVIDRQETTRLMNDILATLSQEQRMAVVMYYYEEMSVREIAQELGCSENTVKSRLKYARDKIEAEVRKLEKKGTKLYSLAPMPFFTWLLRTAKQQGISFALDSLDVFMATGAATAGAAVGEATSTAGVAATGEAAVATAGSAATGTTAAGGAKAAGTAAGKTVATKIVAGTLAATMTVGAGAVAINHISVEKENEAAHVIYEEFLDRYKVALKMDSASFKQEYDRFWNEVSSDILENNPEIDISKINDWSLDYTPGENLGEEIFVPDTVYDPNMNSRTLLLWKLEDEDVRYTEEIPMEQHTYESRIVDPTCTEVGYTVYVCKDCNASYQGNQIEATDHSWGDWKVSKEATEETEGRKDRSCIACGKKESQMIPKLEHFHSMNHIVTKPTCISEGCPGNAFSQNSSAKSRASCGDS